MSRSACGFVRALQDSGRRGSATSSAGRRSVALHLGVLLRQSRRAAVDVDYYIQLGEHAYGSLARQATTRSATCSTSCRDKFPAFVDVLGEVSERSALTSNADLLRLYEKWLRTGSRRSGICWCREASFRTRRSAAASFNSGRARLSSIADESRERRNSTNCRYCDSLIMQSNMTRDDADLRHGVAADSQLFPMATTYELI